MFVWLQVHTPSRHSRLSESGVRRKARIHCKLTRTRLVQEALGNIDPEHQDDNSELHIVAGLVVQPQSAPRTTTYVTPAVREVVRYWEAFIGETTPVVVFEVLKVFRLDRPLLPWFKARGVCNFVMGPHVPPRVLCEVTEATRASLISSQCCVVHAGSATPERMTVEEALEQHHLSGVSTQRLVMTCPLSHSKLLRERVWSSYVLPLPAAITNQQVSLKSRWLTDGLGLAFLTTLTENLHIPSAQELRPQIPDEEARRAPQKDPLTTVRNH